MKKFIITTTIIAAITITAIITYTRESVKKYDEANNIIVASEDIHRYAGISELLH